MPISRQKKNRTKRINPRATGQQEHLIRTGAEVTGVSMTEFILKSACLQAEHLLADQRDFVASSRQWQEFLEMLDRRAQVKPALARLFSQSASPRRGSAK